MTKAVLSGFLHFGLLLAVATLAGGSGHAQQPAKPVSDASKGTADKEATSTTDTLKTIDRLMEQNRQLEKQNQELVEQITTLRQTLAEHQTTPAPSPDAPGQAPSAEAKQAPTETTQTPVNNVSLTSAQLAPSAVPEQQGKPQEEKPDDEKKWGKYTPNLGFKVASTDKGDLSISIYTYVRYLNQLALSSTYINGFGQVVPVVRRQDFQLQKLQFKFLGWIIDPKFTYYLWAWTSNPTMGQGAQVVLAGHVDYKFNKYLQLGGGIYSLPGTRSVEGNFPFWLSVDTRLIGDEFFRPSYTTGINAKGDITDRLRYQAMFANNTSQLGVSALELDNGLNTFAGALVWEGGDFGLGWGDFEDHRKLASRIGGHFNRSHETAQSQPGTETIENTQIRLGDGTLIFTPNIFGPGITVNALDWKMACTDVGLKYHGFSFDAEYYWRWLNNFTGAGVVGLPEIRNHGFQLQASAMAIPKSLQAYAGGSMVLGNLGGGYDTRIGLNWFPFKNKVVRWNMEGLLLYRSPVGYTSVPYNVGSTGFVFHTNLELAF
ncbi:MAG TPA: hypothetical protein VF532_21320 [Candidatus Angelobacter sp.]